MHIERVVESHTGIVLAADTSLRQDFDGISSSEMIQRLERIFGTARTAVFHAGMKGDYKVRVEVSDEAAFVGPEHVISSCCGRLSLPSGSLVVHDGSFDDRPVAVTVGLEPGDYVAAAYVLNEPATVNSSKTKDVFDRIGPWLILASVVTFIAGSAAASWYESALLFFLPVGVIVLAWVAYLLAFNLSGGPEREKKAIEDGPVAFVLQLRKIPSDAGEEAKGCELSV